MKDLLLEKIKDSSLIDENTKIYLLKNYQNFSESQKDIICNTLKNEDESLKDFLLNSLKDQQITLYDLKKSKNNENVKHMQEEELQSKIKDTQEMIQLLDTVY